MAEPLDPLTSHIIEMAWCDKTSFDEIEKQTGVAEKDVIKLMRRNLKAKSFKIWRARVSGRKLKHTAKRQSMNFE